MNPAIETLLYTERGNIIVSILLGLGLSALFVPVCKSNDCIDFISPNMYSEDKKRYRIENNCYQNKVIPVDCELL